MKTLRLAALAAVCFALTSTLSAQQPEFPQPTSEHLWLQQFVGEWDAIMESVAGPDQPAMTCKGTMTSRMLGGFWVISESEADMMGTKMQSIQTIGFDPEKKKYIGTWVDSMLNHMWKYEGSVDPTGRILSLDAEGPSFIDPGKTGKFRDSYEFKSKDHIALTSSMLGEDGKWVVFMKGEYRRKK